MATLKKPAAKAAPAKAPRSAAAAKKTFPAKKTVSTAASTRPPRPTWPAPSDFKPAFYEFMLKTDEFGLVTAGSISGSRFKGRWDRETPVKYDLAEFDAATLTGFAMRFSAGVFAANPTKRIPPNASYRFVLRVSKKSADDTLSARFVLIGMKLANSKKTNWFEDKKDPVYRKLRRCARVLPSAFVAAQLPPQKRSRKEAADE